MRGTPTHSTRFGRADLAAALNTYAFVLATNATRAYGATLRHTTVGPTDDTAPVSESTASASALDWAAFLADVLDGRSAGALEAPASTEFFKSLLRAVSFGQAPTADGPYTLFLPIDSAFSRLAEEQLDALIHDPAALRSLVAAHVVPQRVMAPDLGNGQALTALNGSTLAATAGEAPQVNGATVVGTVEFDGGVVRFINRLL